MIGLFLQVGVGFSAMIAGLLMGMQAVGADIPHELRVNFLFVKFLNEKIFLPKILQHFHFKIA